MAFVRPGVSGYAVTDVEYRCLDLPGTTRLGRVLRSNAASLSLQDSPWRISCISPGVGVLWLHRQCARRHAGQRTLAGWVRQGEWIRGFDVLDVIALHCFKKAVRLSCQSSQFPFSRVCSGSRWPFVAIVLYGVEIMRERRDPAGAWPAEAVVLDRPHRPRRLLRMVCGNAGPRAHVHEHLLYRHLILCAEAMGDILGGSRGRGRSSDGLLSHGQKPGSALDQRSPRSRGNRGRMTQDCCHAALELNLLAAGDDQAEAINLRGLVDNHARYESDPRESGSL